MARWRLMGPHYLNVPGTEWEYKETDRTTGRQARKVFPVPLHLHPDSPGDQNYPGEIIVADRPGGRDIVFIGPPTPDMEPLDEEAASITEAERPKWKHPIDSLPGQFNQSMLDDLMRQMSEVQAGLSPRPAAPVSITGVDPAAFAALQAQVAALLEQNQSLAARLEVEALEALPLKADPVRSARRI